MHSKKLIRKQYKSDPNRLREGIYICKDCHKTVHRYFTVKELAYHINTKEALLENEKMVRYLTWVKKQR